MEKNKMLDSKIEEKEESRRDLSQSKRYRGEKIIVEEQPTEKENDKVIEAISPKYLEKFYSESFRDIEEGDVVKGRIVQIRENRVLVDIGYKSEGTIPIEEFAKYLSEIKEGDEIEVLVELKEDNEGLIVLSKEKANKIKVWDIITRAFENNEVIEGKVSEIIKGGLSVDIGVKAFLPGSQIDLKPIKNLNQFLGQIIKVKIIKLNRRRGNVVLSRRVVLEEEREDKKKQTLATLKEGIIVQGLVKNITEYGAFIDLGGIDGLLHITDISWGRISHPSELFSVGDKLDVLVLNFDKNSGKVSLGLKQKTKDPWVDIEKKYLISSKAKGKVVSITNYGAFIELEKGVEGLVHVSEMSWTKKIKHPSKLVAVNDSVEVVILDIDKGNKRISLGMKQIEPDPWSLIDKKYFAGMKITGKVRNLTEFGAFIEIEDGIDGLLHISDMSWTKNIGHPSEIVHKGEKIDTIILNVDKEGKRISLGLKQLQPDPWSNIEEKYRAGSHVKGKVVRITDFGAFIELESGIDGLLHISQLSKKQVSKAEDIITVGDELTLKVIKVDSNERKIGLSLKEYLDDVEQTEIKDYLSKQSEQGSVNKGN